MRAPRAPAQGILAPCCPQGDGSAFSQLKQQELISSIEVWREIVLEEGAGSAGRKPSQSQTASHLGARGTVIVERDRPPAGAWGASAKAGQLSAISVPSSARLCFSQTSTALALPGAGTQGCQQPQTEEEAIPASDTGKETAASAPPCPADTGSVACQCQHHMQPPEGPAGARKQAELQVANTRKEEGTWGAFSLPTEAVSSVPGVAKTPAGTRASLA